jgi:hypothetical protein
MRRSVAFAIANTPQERSPQCPVHRNEGFGAVQQRSSPMNKILEIAAIAAISSALPHLALAQSSGQTQPSRSIQAQVKNNLAQAGFSDIRIMPESFLVRAKDRDGNPVMMVINPDSVTAITAASASEGNPNSAAQEGQKTSQSAKMTDNPANSSSQQEGNQTTSKSSKMSASQSEDIDGHKLPGRPNGMMSELKQDESGTLKLTAAQKAQIWKELGAEATNAQTPSRTLKVGQTLPDTMNPQSMPGKVANDVPAVKSYQYAMVNGQVLIVDPSTHKIAAIVTE